MRETTYLIDQKMMKLSLVMLWNTFENTILCSRCINTSGFVATQMESDVTLIADFISQSIRCICSDKMLYAATKSDIRSEGLNCSAGYRRY